MIQEKRGTREQEYEIGARERRYDLARNRVVGLEAQLATLTKTNGIQFSNVTHDRNQLQISRVGQELAEARATLTQAKEQMEEAHAWRTAQLVSGE